MKLVKPSFEILEQGPGLQGIYKQIELAGRTCYKSLDKITEDSAEGFVNRMTASKHYAMLEHGTVYLRISHEAMEAKYGQSSEPFSAYRDPISMLYNLECRYGENPYSSVNYVAGDSLYVTTNYRVLIENDWLDDLEYLCEPTEFHEKRVTVRFTTSNGIMREFTRHRSHSFAVESTRYCNYSKDKFNNEIQCIIPSWCERMVEGNSYDWELVHDYNLEQTEGLSEAETRLIMSWSYDEAQYLILLNKGILTAQLAREVLPLATKCDMVMTGFISDWEHFFRLRTSIIAETGKPHPDASALADPLYKEFINRNYLKEI